MFEWLTTGLKSCGGFISRLRSFGQAIAKKFVKNIFLAMQRQIATKILGNPGHLEPAGSLPS